jgi:hypothetical protein
VRHKVQALENPLLFYRSVIHPKTRCSSLTGPWVIRNPVAAVLPIRESSENPLLLFYRSVSHPKTHCCCFTDPWVFRNPVSALLPVREWGEVENRSVSETGSDRHMPYCILILVSFFLPLKHLFSNKKYILHSVSSLANTTCSKHFFFSESFPPPSRTL